MVTVFIEKEQKSIEVDFEGSIASLADFVNVNIETVVCILNDELVNASELVTNSDSVKFLSVISGG